MQSLLARKKGTIYFEKAELLAWRLGSHISLNVQRDFKPNCFR